MGIMNSSSFAKALWPGLNKIYQTSYGEYELEYPKIFENNKSTRAFEEEIGITGFGLAQVKTEGNSISYDEQSQGYLKRYSHVTYGIGFVITREMYEDNLYPEIGLRRAKSLAFSMRQTKEIVHANILNRAFNSDYTGADGVELCSRVHPNKSGGTWANELETAADLSEASLEQCCIDLSDFTTDRGLLIPVKPKMLLIPPELEFEAARILKSVLQYDTANNAINALKTIGKIPQGYVVNHYLTDADAFFLVTDCPDGFKTFVRRSDEFDVDNDFATENAMFKATCRFSCGWTDPRCVYGSPGA